MNTPTHNKIQNQKIYDAFDKAMESVVFLGATIFNESIKNNVDDNDYRRLNYLSGQLADAITDIKDALE